MRLIFRSSVILLVVLCVFEVNCLRWKNFDENSNSSKSEESSEASNAGNYKIRRRRLAGRNSASFQSNTGIQNLIGHPVVLNSTDEFLSSESDDNQLRTSTTTTTEADKIPKDIVWENPIIINASDLTSSTAPTATEAADLQTTVAVESSVFTTAESSSETSSSSTTSTTSDDGGNDSSSSITTDTSSSSTETTTTVASSTSAATTETLSSSSETEEMIVETSSTTTTTATPETTSSTTTTTEVVNSPEPSSSTRSTTTTITAASAIVSAATAEKLTSSSTSATQTDRGTIYFTDSTESTFNYKHREFGERTGSFPHRRQPHGQWGDKWSRQRDFDNHHHNQRPPKATESPPQRPNKSGVGVIEPRSFDFSSAENANTMRCECPCPGTRYLDNDIGQLRHDPGRDYRDYRNRRRMHHFHSSPDLY